MTEANNEATTEQQELKPTSAADLKKIRREEVVELPAFLDGTPFNVMLRRPSILRMAQLGQIPNTLSAAVDEMMAGKQEMKSDIQERAEVLTLVARAAMVEPTYEEVEDIIDTYQLDVIWHWVVYGSAMLVPFRKIREVFATHSYERAVEAETERDTGSEPEAA